MIGRVLEEGDSEDLRWLTRALGEEVLTGWLERRGGRALSNRSLAFWQRVLNVRCTPAQAGVELWPL